VQLIRKTVNVLLIGITTDGPDGDRDLRIRRR
jgi:hypothetical protein